MRIGIISWIHESNTFISRPTTLEDFRRESLCTGDEVVQRWGNTSHEIGGFLEGVQSAAAEPVPLLAAWAMPSGAVEAKTYHTILDMIVNSLQQAAPLDGLLLAPHGAGVSEEHPDMDGHWLSIVREQVGPDMPMVCTLDPHANLSQRMVDACNATIGYRTNPHLDQRQIGLQAADLMLRSLRGEIQPTQAASFPRIAINIERQMTADDPCKTMYDFADQILGREGVLSNSILLGFAFSDVVEMGTSFVAVTDNDPALAETCATEMASHLLDRRQEFVPHLRGIEEAVDLATRSKKPVCLLDMGDNVGGGAPGDSTFLAHALHSRRISKCFVSLNDPESVQKAEQVGIGKRVTLQMGGKTDQRHGKPLQCAVTVKSLHDGDYTEPHTRHGGRSWGAMGRTAIVETENGMTVQLTSIRNAPLSIEHIRCCDLDPATFDILVAKGVISPVAAYREFCQTMLRVNTPGSTSADMTSFDYHHRRQPLFPFEAT